MPDIITHTERALIDAFLAEHGDNVTVPRGVSSEPTYIYDPLANGQLRSSQPMPLRERIKQETMAAKRARYHAKRRRVIQERRRLVLELHQTGRDIEQIAAHVGVHPETVKGDLKAIREGQR